MQSVLLHGYTATDTQLLLINSGKEKKYAVNYHDTYLAIFHSPLPV
jgi:hypothetical protein